MAGDWDELYRQEAERIAPQADRVSRAGDVLRLALAGGGRVELVNPPGFCAGAADGDVYSFHGYDDALAADVVVLSHRESGEVVLVDGRSGRQTLIADLPHVSPDRTRGACPRRDRGSPSSAAPWRASRSRWDASSQTARSAPGSTTPPSRSSSPAG